MRKQESQLPENYTITDIEGVFTHDEILEIDTYQREQAAHPRFLIQGPIPLSIIDKYRRDDDKDIRDLHKLTGNMSRFDEATEAIIAEDVVMKAIKEATSPKYKYPKEDVAEAQRARRSVIAYLAVKSTVV